MPKTSTKDPALRHSCNSFLSFGFSLDGLQLQKAASRLQHSVCHFSLNFSVAYNQIYALVTNRANGLWKYHIELLHVAS